MATTSALKSIPGTVDIPSNLSSFKTTPQVIWTNNNTQAHGAFTPSHGWQRNFFTDNAHGKHDNNYTPNIYSFDQNQGLKWTNRKIGNQHQQITEIGLQGGANCRWMGANIFNGFGFEVLQGSSKHALYYGGCALAFYNGSSWRTWGHEPNDGFPLSAPKSGYRYIYMNDSASINTIRNWGNSWKLTGINFWIRNEGGSGSEEGIDIHIYNLRIGSKVTTLGNQYRMIPAGKRSWSNRNANSGNVPITDPFT